MRHRFNIIGLGLLATFVMIFGSIFSMSLFSKSQGTPTEISIEAVAATGEE